MAVIGVVNPVQCDPLFDRNFDTLIGDGRREGGSVIEQLLETKVAQMRKYFTQKYGQSKLHQF